jgi:hypothetical protein
MKYVLEIKEEAVIDIQKAYDYYEENRIGLGERFLNTLDYYFERIQKQPQHYQIRRKPYREAFVKDFPYLIIYEIIGANVIVYAVFNTYLDPKKKPSKK